MQYMFMAVTSGNPALQLSSRTLGFFSSLFFFVTLCSIEDWVTVDSHGSHRLPGPLPCAAVWLIKLGIRRVTRSGSHSNLRAFDVGVSTFGALSLNFVVVAHAVDRTRAKLLCLLEACFGIAIGGRPEIVGVATTFLVPLLLADLFEVGENLPLCAFVLSSSAIGASALLARDKNRERLSNLLQAIFFIPIEQPSFPSS